jgi:hypothetical protein
MVDGHNSDTDEQPQMPNVKTSWPSSSLNKPCLLLYQTSLCIVGDNSQLSPAAALDGVRYGTPRASTTHKLQQTFVESATKQLTLMTR